MWQHKTRHDKTSTFTVIRIQWLSKHILRVLGRVSLYWWVISLVVLRRLGSSLPVKGDNPPEISNVPLNLPVDGSCRNLAEHEIAFLFLGTILSHCHNTVGYWNVQLISAYYVIDSCIHCISIVCKLSTICMTFTRARTLTSSHGRRIPSSETKKGNVI